jgi:pescadillo protein
MIRSGKTSRYLTRNQVLKKLKIKLSMFRRLCIIKGIYPREPERRPKGNIKLFYDTKEITSLMHDPLLQKFREIRSSIKKIKRAHSKGEFELADKIINRIPAYRLDHLIRERYPTFLDALRDIDDCLKMINLFATLPADKNTLISPKDIEKCRIIVLEFQAYVIYTFSLHQAFLTVKGIFHQAEIMGQAVTWVEPHRLGQVIPGDVDFRVMSTFIEFNIVLMQFVNFRLYHEIGIKQPHILDLRNRGNIACLDSIIYNIFHENRTVIETKTRFKSKNHSINGESNIPRELDQLRAYTNSLTRREEIEQTKQGHNHKYGGKNKKKTFSNNDYFINIKVQQSRPNTNIEQCDNLTAPLEFDYSHCESTNCKSIFMGMVFYLSREVPYEQLSFIIKAFGGKTVLDHPSFPISIKPDSVTYYVVDRPLQNYKRDNMKLIQPQWIIDSINFNMLVPINLYAPGMVLPPHLCPFANQEEEEFSQNCFESIKKSYAAAASKHYKSRNLDGLTSK